jgi:hypothetical protein
MGIVPAGITSHSTPTFRPPAPPPGYVAPSVPAGPIVVPSVIAPAAPPPEVVATIVASQTQTAQTEAQKASRANAMVTGNVAAAQQTARAIKDAVATVPTFQAQQAAANTAKVTTPAQRADVAAIVDKAKQTLAAFQPSYETPGGVVVTAASPTPTDGGIAFGDLPAPKPIVPKLIADDAPVTPADKAALGVAAGGTANASGPPTGLLLAAAVIALLFFVKV